MNKPRALIGISGGGTGLNNLCEATADGRLDMEIIGVVHNVPCGGLAFAKKHGVPTRHFPKHERVSGAHERLVHEMSDGDPECFLFLSGALWPVEMKHGPDDPGPGLDPRFGANIHPGLLSLLGLDETPLLGGDGMHGDHVHMKALKEGLSGSGLGMHFLTKKYDGGPIVFEYPLPIIYEGWEHLKKGVNAMEHYFQPYVTNLIAHRKIRWDGKNRDSLIVPDGYRFLPQATQYTPM